MRKNIIIDTDPGVDDAFALIYGFKNSEFNILGLTTVSGNNGINRVTDNTLKLVEFMNEDIKVYEGEGKPYIREVSKGDDVHGNDGLGGVVSGGVLKVDGKNKIEEKNAIDFIIEMAEKYNDISLITLGPLTNIARAIEKNPTAMKNIVEIVSMGGGIHQGNVTEYAEFNYWADPEAAKIVFDFEIPITMVGLNATNYSLFTVDEFDYIKSLNTSVGDLLYEMQKPYTESYSKTHGINGCRIHDLLAIIIANNDKVGKGRHGEIKISLDENNRGESIVDYDSEKKDVLVIEDIDVDLYKKEFYEKVFGKNI